MSQVTFSNTSIHLPTTTLPGVVWDEPGAAGRLDATEIRRRVWHMSPGLLPLLLWCIPHLDPWGPVLLWVVGVLISTTTCVMLVRFQSVARQGEQMGVAAVLGYAGSVLGMIFLFPGQAEIAMAVLAVLAFGDGSATLFGLLLRGPKLPWNKMKSWSGLCAFALMGTLGASIMFWGESYPGVSIGVALAVGGLMATVSALVESLPISINDNIRVGVTASSVGLLAHLWLC